MTRPPATIAVVGSCITRDNFNSTFNPGYRARFDCALLQNQSSIIALVDQPMEVDWEPLDPAMSDHDRWNVATEFDRSFWSELERLQPTYLLLDFFGDIHFGVVVTPTGECVTNNRWKVQKTSWYARARDAGELEPLTIVDATDDYIARWKGAFDTFIARVRRLVPDTVVILNRGRNTNRLRLPDGEVVALQKNVNLAALDVRRANRLWARLDTYASRRVDHVIDLRSMRAPTFAEHPWGPFYVHYVPEYYTAFLDWLDDIDEIHRGGPFGRRRARRALAARVTAVEAVRQPRDRAPIGSAD